MPLSSYNQIHQQQLAGEYVIALDSCQKALNQSPENLALITLLTTLFCQLEQFEHARHHLQKALSKSGEFDAFIHTEIAGIYILLSEPFYAIKHLHTALQLDADFLLAKIRRGLVLIQAGYFALAISDFQYGLAKLPQEQHLAMHINLARCHLQLGELTNALTHINIALELGGAKREAWLCVAVDYHIAKQDFVAAELALLASQNIGISELLTLKIRALIWAAQNKHQAAENILQQGLKQYADHLEIYTQLADIACVRGRYSSAVVYLRQALGYEETNADLWMQLATVGRFCLSSVVVRQAAEQGLCLTAKIIGIQRAKALVTMAQVETDAENYVLAENLYQQALQEIPDYIPAELGLGYLQLQWGRITAANDLFSRVAQQHSVAGYSALIHTRQLPKDPELLRKIAEIAYLPSIQGPVATNILFDLASAWEQQHNYPLAFQFATDANQSMRHQLTYDAQQHTDYCRRLIATFNSDFFAKRQNFGNDSCLPVFILGMPRSGTTLIEQLLGGHEDIFVAGEIASCSQAIQKLNAWELHMGSGVSFPECVYDLTFDQIQQLAQGILSDLRTFHPTVRYIIDKLPHNFENIGLIHLLFPHAKIIHIQRDPRDVAISTYFTHFQAKHSGMGYAYDLTDIGNHILDYQRLMQHWIDTLCLRILTLAYEDVVDDTETAVKSILNYLQLDWNAKILEHQQLQRPVKTASIWQVRQSIYTSSKAKWRRYANFIAPLEQILQSPPSAASQENSLPLNHLPPGLFFHGMELLKTRQYPAAKNIFTQILEHNPQHAAANHMLGLSFFHLGDFFQAQKYLALSVTLHPGHATWYSNLAQLYRQLNCYTEAQDALEKIRQLNIPASH